MLVTGEIFKGSNTKPHASYTNLTNGDLLRTAISTMFVVVQHDLTL